MPAPQRVYAKVLQPLLLSLFPDRSCICKFAYLLVFEEQFFGYTVLNDPQRAQNCGNIILTPTPPSSSSYRHIFTVVRRCRLARERCSVSAGVGGTNTVRFCVDGSDWWTAPYAKIIQRGQSLFLIILPSWMYFWFWSLPLSMPFDLLRRLSLDVTTLVV